LERADKTLRHHITKKGKLEIEEIQSILFQILYTLYHAQKSMEFMHNDLHFKNVLIKNLPKDVKQTVFYVNDKKFVSKLPFIIKITDFGLSRITLGNGSAIYNPVRTKWFDPAADLIQLASQLKGIAINWESVENHETQKGLLSNLKKMLKKPYNVDLDAILNHPFFESMNVDSSDEKSIVFGGVPCDLKQFQIKKEVSPIKPLDYQIVNNTIIKSRKERRQLADLNTI
jgi:hypothetical protein